MPLNMPTKIDDVTIASIGARCIIERGGDPQAVNVTQRIRAGTYPEVTGVTYEPRRLPFSVIREPSGVLDDGGDVDGDADVDADADTDSDDDGPEPLPAAGAEFDIAVRRMFGASGNVRTFTATRDGTEWLLSFRIVSFDRVRPGQWRGEILVTDPVWLSVPTDPVATSPVTIGGTVPARPVIHLTGGEPAMRRRLIVRDRSGTGIYSWPVPVNIAGDGMEPKNYQVWFQGLPQPFSVADGYLWFRVAANATDASYVDVIHSAAIDNSAYLVPLDSGRDAGGVVLNPAIASSGVVVSDPSGVTHHPRSASLAWQPGISGEHAASASYTMGFDGDNLLRLIDTSATGRRWKLKDDADSYVLVSPVPITQLSGLQVRCTTGVLVGRGSWLRDRMLRVTIQDANGRLLADPVLPPDHWRKDIAPVLEKERHPLVGYGVEFSFAGITFPRLTDTRHQGSWSIGNRRTGHTRIYTNDYLPAEFGRLVRDFMPQGDEFLVAGPIWENPQDVPFELGPGQAEWFLRFTRHSFGRLERIPDFQMAIKPKTGMLIDYRMDSRSVMVKQVDRRQGRADPPVWVSTTIQVLADRNQQEFGVQTLDNVTLINNVWVDPDSLEPLDSNVADSTPARDAYGITDLVVWYWVPDDERPREAYRQTIVGAVTPATVPAVPGGTITAIPDGLQYDITIPPLDLPGAVKVAVGLAPTLNSPRHVTWGSCQITAPVTVQLDTDRLPAVTTIPVEGQILDGTIRNITTGRRIRLVGVYADAAGLDIDTRRLEIGGAGGVGMVYGDVLPDGGLRWFDLPVGPVYWETLGALADADVSLSWQTGIVGNS